MLHSLFQELANLRQSSYVSFVREKLKGLVTAELYLAQAIGRMSLLLQLLQTAL